MVRYALTDLGTLGGADSGASAIDEHGEIVGAARAREVARARHDPRAVGRAWLDLLTEVAGRRAAWPASRRDESPVKPAVLSSEQFDGLSAGQY